MKTLTWILVFVCTPFALHARPVPAWSYVKLRDQADLIVVATPVSIKETKEVSPLPGIARQSPDGKQSPVMGIAIESTFKALMVLKGDDTVTSFVLHHYREQANEPSMNGPTLISFDPQKKKRFLMFLKKETDGRYVAVTGQTDPAFSIKEFAASWP